MADQTFLIYVLELDEAIKSKPGFLAANPLGKKACLYVGSTAKTAEDRLLDHRDGRPSGSRYIRGFVKCLRPDLAPSSRLLTRKNAEVREEKYAESLRRRGYFVWQN